MSELWEYIEVVDMALVSDGAGLTQPLEHLYEVLEQCCQSISPAMRAFASSCKWGLFRVCRISAASLARLTAS